MGHSRNNRRQKLNRGPNRSQYGGLKFVQTPHEALTYGCPCCNLDTCVKPFNIHCPKCHANGQLSHLHWSSIHCPNCYFQINNMFYTPEYELIQDNTVQPSSDNTVQPSSDNTIQPSSDMYLPD